jgi:hypothetical protein
MTIGPTAIGRNAAPSDVPTAIAQGNEAWDGRDKRTERPYADVVGDSGVPLNISCGRTIQSKLSDDSPGRDHA